MNQPKPLAARDYDGEIQQLAAMASAVVIADFPKYSLYTTPVNELPGVSVISTEVPEAEHADA